MQEGTTIFGLCLYSYDLWDSWFLLFEVPAMPRPKPPVSRLFELKQGDSGDFFALLAERTRSATREGKPYYACRFRDARRTATYMVWADGEFFDACQTEWKEGRCYKIRAAYGEHDRYGP